MSAVRGGGGGTVFSHYSGHVLADRYYTLILAHAHLDVRLITDIVSWAARVSYKACNSLHSLVFSLSSLY